MSAPRNEYSFDVEIMRQAAENYRSQTPERERKKELLDKGRYDKVDGKERLAKRVNRLISHLKDAAPQAQEALPSDVRAVVKRGKVGEEEVDNELLERVVGATRDFLGAAFFDMGLEANRSVGRIVTRLGGGRVSYGTGFLVSPRLLLTNWHVLHSEDEAARSMVEFDYQLNRLGNALTIERHRLDPQSFFLNFKNLDFALVAVSEISERGTSLSGRSYCPLIKEEGKVTQGLDCLNIIQHPRGEMKQIVIRENRLVDLPKNLDWVAHYEGDTEPGSSGSPVFNDQWEVVALHHSGVPKTDSDGNFLDVKGKIWRKGDDPALLAWVANEGIRISRLVNHLAGAEVREHEKELLRNMLNQNPMNGLQPDSPTEQKDERKPETRKADASQIKSTNTNPVIDLAGGLVTLTIPLHITISLGTPSTFPQISAQVASRDEDFQEKIEIDPNYENRRGYNSEFLGFSVPLPKLTPAIRGQAVEVGGATGANKFELKYYNYSVIMNGKRRIAFVSAVNFNQKPKFKHKREEGKEVWSPDPRIPKDKQSEEKNYADPEVDRGHLARRADAGWGDTMKEAKLANDDTFHFTNCSPQHEIFNQSTLANREGVLLWGNLEEHVAKQARDNNKKVSVFNGPILRSNDPKHMGLQVPREFYKIVVFENDQGKPRSLAFILSQASLIKDLPEEEFEVGPYEPFQVRVREVETKTKLDFGKLRDFDALEGEENENFFESGTEAVPLTTLRDIVL